MFPAQSRDLGWRKKEAYTLKVQPGKGKRKMKLKLNLFPVEAVWFDVPVTGNTLHKKNLTKRTITITTVFITNGDEGDRKHKHQAKHAQNIFIFST